MKGENMEIAEAALNSIWIRNDTKHFYEILEIDNPRSRVSLADIPRAVTSKTFYVSTGVLLKEYTWKYDKATATLPTPNIPELKSFTITYTVKLIATDTEAALLKASQLLTQLANGTPYEFEMLNVKVE